MTLFDRGFALVVGIANYQKVRPMLSEAVLNDAADIRRLLTDPAHGGYPLDRVKCLIDERATAANIRQALHWLAQVTDQDDTVIIFFSGHGGRLESGAHLENYLIPVDAAPDNLAETALAGAELTRLLRQIQAGRLVALFDCCHAGGTGEVKASAASSIPGFKAGLAEPYYDRLATGQGRVIMAASRSTELSWILNGMRNSLFTHYLLEALRGGAHTYGDGLIRILDVFNFIAGEMAGAQPQQHPILKAEVEANFPIALYLGGKQSASSNPGLTIQNPKKLSFPAGARQVLTIMFANYRRIVLEKEFGGGFSGGRVFLIHPVRRHAYRELPAIVKLASISLIQQEWQAYQTCIRDRLPNSVGVRGQPVLPPDSDWGGLRYPLVGSGKFAITGLRDYAGRASLADLRFTLEERLLPIMEQVMQFHQVSPLFSISASYDPILPVNLLIKPAPLPPDARSELVAPAHLPETPLKAGDSVRLEGFVVTKVDLRNQTVDLNLPPSVEEPVSYWVRVQFVETMASARVHQLIEPIEGEVIETRSERLQAEAQRALGPDFDLTAETVAWPGGPELPNPLARWPALFNDYRDVKVGCIHGDLNLENILVDPATRDVSLIDFAAAREDHLLHDFLRLETEVVTKLIPEILARANLGVGVIRLFYEHLHAVVAYGDQPDELPHPTLDRPFAMLMAIRQQASHYLVKVDDWTEYYHGLALYLLGALKFGNLDPIAKQMAFWGAGVVLEIVENKPLSIEVQKEISMQFESQSNSSEHAIQYSMDNDSATNNSL